MQNLTCSLVTSQITSAGSHRLHLAWNQTSWGTVGSPPRSEAHHCQSCCRSWQRFSMSWKWHQEGTQRAVGQFETISNVLVLLVKLPFLFLHPSLWREDKLPRLPKHQYIKVLWCCCCCCCSKEVPLWSQAEPGYSGIHYAAQIASWWSSCLNLLSDEIKGTHAPLSPAFKGCLLR